jgi:hypothetical protein
MTIEFELHDHIATFDGAFSSDYCNKIIDFFEYRSVYLPAYNRESSWYKDSAISVGDDYDFLYDKGYVTQMFSELNRSEIFHEFMQTFWDQCYPLYLSEYPHNTTSLSRLSLSSLKIQKTLPKGGYHMFHCENGNTVTSRRAMFIILYLNTVDDGGETEFLYQSKRIAPVQGRLILSPTGYTHIHRGNPPLSQPKYILTTWVEYQE